MDATLLRRTTRILAMTMAVLACNCAWAQLQGPPTIPAGASTDQVVSNPTGSVENTGNGAFVDNGVAQAEALYTGNDGMVSLTIRPGSSDYAVARATTSWNFIVLGPEGVSQIPLVLIGSGKLSIQNAGANTSVMDMAKVSSSVGHFNTEASLSFNTQENFGISLGGYVVDNQMYQISMSVFAYSIGGTTASIQAEIDPIVAFDSYFDSDGFTIVSSPVPDVQEPSPVASVPEPETAVLLLSGLLLSGFARRSSRVGGARVRAAGLTTPTSATEG